MIYAVIDTNVLASSLSSKDGTSNPAIVVLSVINGVITPIYNDEILEEYREVLSRPKFGFPNHLINDLLALFTEFGIEVSRVGSTGEYFPDKDDIVFYEVKMSVDDAYLVTGNTKHFPATPLIVSPAQMVSLLYERVLLR